MVASVHFADVNAKTALSLLRRAPAPAEIPGLRSARVALATPLRTRFLPPPTLGRVGLVTFWDDESALDAFEADGIADAFMSGWRARLEPLRAYGTWPGLGEGVTASRKVEYDGVALVLTLGRTRYSQAIRFMRTSLTAERAANVAPGMIWGTAMARPPFVGTCSLWDDAASIGAYAFDDRDAAHPVAITRDRAKPFHHEEAFIRFRPYAVHGNLEGRNPLSADRVPLA